MPIPEPACAVLPEHTRWRRAELVNELGNFSGSAMIVPPGVLRRRAQADT